MTLRIPWKFEPEKMFFVRDIQFSSELSLCGCGVGWKGCQCMSPIFISDQANLLSFKDYISMSYSYILLEVFFASNYPKSFLIFFKKLFG